MAEDDKPPFDNPAGHVPLIARTNTRLRGAAAIGQISEITNPPSPIGGAAANGVAGQVRTSSEAADTTDIRGVVFDTQVASTRFEALEARVRVLETLFGDARPSLPPGVGHNLGPPITAEDEDEIKHLVALLKEVTPTTVTRRAEIVETADKASKIVEKIKEYADAFFLSAAKKGGEKLGENIFKPTWWLGIGAVIASAVEALHWWLAAIPR